MSAAEARRFDPANDTHYAISEEAEYRLRQIADGAEAVGMLLEGLDTDRVEIRQGAIGNIFHVFGFAIAGAIQDRAVVFPRRP